jgi:hypothetical protein
MSCFYYFHKVGTFRPTMKGMNGLLYSLVTYLYDLNVKDEWGFKVETGKEIYGQCEKNTFSHRLLLLQSKQERLFCSHTSCLV